MLHRDPQEGREKHQAAEEYEHQHYPGLAEHDEMHEDDGGFNATRTDVHRMDGGGVDHAAGRVAHAMDVHATYGDHSPTAHHSPATRPMGPGLSSIERDNSAHRASQRGMIHSPSTEEEAAEMHRGGGSTATTKMFGPG